MSCYWAFEGDEDYGAYDEDGCYIEYSGASWLVNSHGRVHYMDDDDDYDDDEDGYDEFGGYIGHDDFDEIREYEMLRRWKEEDDELGVCGEDDADGYTSEGRTDGNDQLDNDLPESTQGTEKYVAIDCEFVGVGHDGVRNALGRVSIVDWDGRCLYDTYVRTHERVTNYRTWVSGVTKNDLVGAPSFEEVRDKVIERLQGRIVIGHTINSDLDVLRINPSSLEVRDIATWQPFRQKNGGRTPSLRQLARDQINTTIQERGQPHDSVEDARATMAVYRTVHDEWTRTLKRSD